MNRRILIVDDDYFIRRLLVEFFRTLGYDVLSLKSGKEIMQGIGIEQFDLIITDYSLSDMDGVELIHYIRSINPSLPIIGISGSCEEKKLLDAGANYFIAKPFDLKQIKEIVERIL